MPLITRIPVVPPPAADLPDPTQRVARLRELLRFYGWVLTVAALIGAVPGVLGAMALTDVHLDAADPLVPGVIMGWQTWQEWGDLRRRIDVAEPLPPLVSLVRARLWGGPLRAAALLASGAALLVFALTWLSGSYIAVGFVASFAPRTAALLALLARRERRDGTVYLERADLDDDEVLHADPETVAALERA